jgi:hypothetical protein
METLLFLTLNYFSTEFIGGLLLLMIIVGLSGLLLCHRRPLLLLLFTPASLYLTLFLMNALPYSDFNLRLFEASEFRFATFACHAIVIVTIISPILGAALRFFGFKLKSNNLP